MLCNLDVDATWGHVFGAPTIHNPLMRLQYVHLVLGISTCEDISRVLYEWHGLHNHGGLHTIIISVAVLVLALVVLVVVVLGVGVFGAPGGCVVVKSELTVTWME